MIDTYKKAGDIDYTVKETSKAMIDTYKRVGDIDYIVKEIICFSFNYTQKIIR